MSSFSLSFFVWTAKNIKSILLSLLLVASSFACFSGFAILQNQNTASSSSCCCKGQIRATTHLDIIMDDTATKMRGDDTQKVSSSTSLSSTTKDMMEEQLQKDYYDNNNNTETDEHRRTVIFNTTVQILERGLHHFVIAKPPAVLCHHSDWAGSRSNKAKMKKKVNEYNPHIDDDPDPEDDVPMLQRIREAVGERINLVHRLDRAASGCLLCTKASSDNNVVNDIDFDSGAEDKEGDDAGDDDGSTSTLATKQKGATAVLQKAMMSETSTKTYIALVRGEGILKGRDFRKEGWFEVSRPIKNARGNLGDATTSFRFIAGQDNGMGTIDRARASIVLCRPKTGRWHQIRRHLNGLAHPIIGDTAHGNNKLNREWRETRGLIPQRTCLHLLKLDIPTPIDDNDIIPNGINVVCPLPSDFLELLEKELPEVLEEAERIILEEEGIRLRSAPGEIVGEEVDVTVKLFR